MGSVFTNFLSTVTRESGPETVSQFTLRSGYMHFRPDGWIVSPFAYITRNRDLGLSPGSDAALIAGRYLQRSNRGEILVACAGAAARRS